MLHALQRMNIFLSIFVLFSNTFTRTRIARITRIILRRTIGPLGLGRQEAPRDGGHGKDFERWLCFAACLSVNDVSSSCCSQTNGRMEPWIFDLASALKVRLERVNVLISDWRKLALQPYPVAAKNSRQVGRDVAALLKWLEVMKEVAQLCMDDVHLIGYSLGAHVAGFAGSHFRGLRKVGRITGLDPAGPHFEGLPAFDRLSPDDAQFVDAVHTFTGSSIVPGVGIKQSVAHVDFYPNGGSFQPGCKMLDIYSNTLCFIGVPKTIKCAHERAVKLFTDSLINASQPIIGYRCRDDSAFSRGLCLDCKQLRCNTLGFAVRHDRSGRSAKGLFLRTTPQPPYRGVCVSV
uniref:Lipase, hepatic b n=1 Tax=Sinocyclocheilus anshuiensis TaxID=1608454 RepID=A0A671PQL8_9TELE